MLLPENPAEEIFTEPEWMDLQKILRLSRREVTVAKLTFESRSRKGIAIEMGIHYETVRTYSMRMFSKLNVKDNIGLIVRLVRVHRLLQSHGHPATQ